MTNFCLSIVLLCASVLPANAQVPPVAPPDLPHAAENVVSFFSDKYDVAYPGMVQTWGGPASWDYTGTGDEQSSVLVLNNLGYLAIELKTEAGGGVNVPLRNYFYVHIDVFCNEETEFRAGFHSHNTGGTEKYFPMIEKGTMTPGKWYSIDYDLDWFFTDGGWTYTWDAQYLRFGGDAGLGDYTPDYSSEIYVTNFVLLGEGCTPTALGGKVIEGTGITLPAKESGFNAWVSGKTLYVSAKEAIGETGIFNLAGQQVKNIPASGLTSKTDVSGLAPGVYIVQATLGNGQKVSAKIINR